MQEDPVEIFEFGPFRLDQRNARLTASGPIPLSRKAFELLGYLVSRPDQLVTKDDLLSAVWPDVIVTDGALKVAVRELRKALDDDARNPEYIETVHGRGYRFIKKLSATSHSAVYLAEKESAGLMVVLKVLQQVPDNSDSIGAFDRFLQEYELIAELEHPNIVQIYDLGVGDNHAHIAMEYLEGGDLKQRIAAGITEPDAIRYFEQMTSAIAEIHKVDILQRYTGLVQTISNSVSRKTRIVFFTCKALFLRRSDDVTVYDQRSGAIMIICRNP